MPLAALDQFDFGERTQAQNSQITPLSQGALWLAKKIIQPNWFQTFAWLEYSEKKDSAYCFACHVFGKNLKQDIFVSSGFKIGKWCSMHFTNMRGPNHTRTVLSLGTVTRLVRYEEMLYSRLKQQVLMKLDKEGSTCEVLWPLPAC